MFFLSFWVTRSAMTSSSGNHICGRHTTTHSHTQVCLHARADLCKQMLTCSNHNRRNVQENIYTYNLHYNVCACVCPKYEGNPLQKLLLCYLSYMKVMLRLHFVEVEKICQYESCDTWKINVLLIMIFLCIYIVYSIVLIHQHPCHISPSPCLPALTLLVNCATTEYSHNVS